MKQITAKGRQLGKSTISGIQSKIIQSQALQMQQTIDLMIMDEFWDLPATYRIEKSWTDRRGGKMYRISVSGRVLEWLDSTQSQYGISNPSWWKFQDQINITEKMLSLLMLKWGRE